MISGLFDDHPARFIPVFYHLNGDAWQEWCDTRSAFFPFGGAPYLWLDGTVDAGANYGDWEHDLLTRAIVPTDISIDFDVVLSGIHLTVDSTICVEAGGTAKDLRIYVVQILDNYPASETYYRNAFRQVTTQEVSIGSGECVDIQKTRSLKNTDLEQLQDVGIVVWAQQPLSSGPAEIFQAAASFPFIMNDGFESGDLSAWE